jgi:predicted nucleic acid-binding protein
MTLIDTSAWIEFFRRRGDPTTKTRVATLIELGEAAFCGPIEFELLTGARSSERRDINRALDYSHLLDFPRECWQRAAKIEQSVRRRGVMVPRDDILVAATALHHDVAVYAIDPHFELLVKRGRVRLDLYRA